MSRSTNELFAKIIFWGYNRHTMGKKIFKTYKILRFKQG